jgi:hypothetical protein
MLHTDTHTHRHKDTDTRTQGQRHRDRYAVPHRVDVGPGRGFSCAHGTALLRRPLACVGPQSNDTARTVRTLCPCTHTVPLYAHRAPVRTPCPCTHTVPLYAHRAPVRTPPALYAHRAPVRTPCPCTHTVPLYAHRAPVRSRPETPMLERHFSLRRTPPPSLAFFTTPTPRVSPLPPLLHDVRGVD